jgi:hypothetical protein
MVPKLPPVELQDWEFVIKLDKDGNLVFDIYGGTGGTWYNGTKAGQVLSGIVAQLDSEHKVAKEDGVWVIYKNGENVRSGKSAE